MSAAGALVAAAAALPTAAAHGRPPALTRRLGRVEYLPTWRAMQRFTEERSAATPDEIWFLEHPPEDGLVPADGDTEQLGLKTYAAG